MRSNHCSICGSQRSFINRKGHYNAQTNGYRPLKGEGAPRYGRPDHDRLDRVPPCDRMGSLRCHWAESPLALQAPKIRRIKTSNFRPLRPAVEAPSAVSDPTASGRRLSGSALTRPLSTNHAQGHKRRVARRKASLVIARDFAKYDFGFVICFISFCSAISALRIAEN